MGTVFEGFVWIPKQEGVKKGWNKVWLVVSNAKLSFHLLSKKANRVSSNSMEEVPEMQAFSIVDMR